MSQFGGNWALWAAVALVVLLASVAVMRRRAKNMADDFTRRFEAQVQTLSPQAAVKINSPLRVEVDDCEINLANAYKSYLLEPHRGDAILEHFSRAAIKLSRSEGEPPTADNLVPVIRRRDDGKPEALVVLPFSETMIVTMAQDTEVSLAYPVPAHVEALGIPQSDLIARTVKNLAGLTPQPMLWQQVDHDVMVLEHDDNAYVSSIALFDPYWENAPFSVPKPYVLFVPSRSTLVLSSSASNAGLAKARRIAEQIYATAPYPISTEPLLRQKGQWVTFKP